MDIFKKRLPILLNYLCRKDMNDMKKMTILISLILVMAQLLCGCGSTSTTETNTSSSTINSSSSYSSSYDDDNYDYNDDDYGSGYSYDKNDKYYSSNDHNNDGKISDSEFQDAMGDAIDDLLEEYDY